MHLQGAVEPALARPDRGLRLNHDKRNAVDKQYEVRSLLSGSGMVGVLRRHDVLVALDVGEVDQVDGDMLPVRAKWHRPIAGQPVGELLVGLHETVSTHAYEDGAQPVENVFSAVRKGCYLAVKPDQRLP